MAIWLSIKGSIEQFTYSIVYKIFTSKLFVCQRVTDLSVNTILIVDIFPCESIHDSNNFFRWFKVSVRPSWHVANEKVNFKVLDRRFTELWQCRLKHKPSGIIITFPKLCKKGLSITRIMIVIRKDIGTRWS